MHEWNNQSLEEKAAKVVKALQSFVSTPMAVVWDRKHETGDVYAAIYQLFKENSTETRYECHSMFIRYHLSTTKIAHSLESNH